MIAGLYDNIFIPRCGMHTLLWHMLSFAGVSANGVFFRPWASSEMERRAAA
jgi:hypothetical protein